MENLIKNLRDRLNLIEKKELLFDQLLESIEFLIEKKRKGKKSKLIGQIKKLDNAAIRDRFLVAVDPESSTQDVKPTSKNYQGLRYKDRTNLPDVEGIPANLQFMINLEKYPVKPTQWDEMVEKGIDLALILHRAYGVSNQAKLGRAYFHKSGNLDLEDFKSHYDNFMIWLGPLGWAAIKPDEEYLQKKFKENPDYVPSDDDLVKYVAIFSTLDKTQPFTRELNPKDPEAIKNLQKQVNQGIKGTRGGSYGKTEVQDKRLDMLSTKKSAARLALGRGLETIADEIKLVIGASPITVWQLKERDVEHQKIDPRRLMGRRSGEIPTTGDKERPAPIERTKKTAREPSSALIFRLSDILSNISVKDQITNIIQTNINNNPELDPDGRFEKIEKVNDSINNLFSNKNKRLLIDTIDRVLTNTGFLKLSEIETIIQEYKEKIGKTDIDNKLALLEIYFSKGNDLIRQRKIVKREFLNYFIKYLSDKLIQD